MNFNDIISALLLGVIAFVSGWVAIYWHIATKGTWWHWPAGRSLMGLLGIIAVGFGYGVFNKLIGHWPGRELLSIILYALFVGAIIFIGFTVRAEMRAGKKRLRAKHHTHTGPVIVTVASQNEENPNDNPHPGDGQRPGAPGGPGSDPA